MRTAPLVIALALAGCLSNPPSTTSAVEIPLQQVGTNGVLYRLVGTFSIAAGDGSTVVVDGTTTDPTLSVDLPPGFAFITLEPGWLLEQSTNGGAQFQQIDAILSSPNPAGVRVLANQPVGVEFDFIVRTTNGPLTISFGVDPSPRELAGPLIASTGTLDYAAYATRRLDFAIYFDSPPVRQTLPDGTHQLAFTSLANNAMEVFNDPIGLLRDSVAPGMAGGTLQYTVSAKLDGTTEVAGVYTGFNSPSTLSFGPHTQAVALPLDADGYPVDTFFFDLEMPFTLDTSFDDGDATMTGTLRMRFIPAM